VNIREILGSTVRFTARPKATALGYRRVGALLPRPRAALGSRRGLHGSALPRGSGWRVGSRMPHSAEKSGTSAARSASTGKLTWQLARELHSPFRAGQLCLPSSGLQSNSSLASEQWLGPSRADFEGLAVADTLNSFDSCSGKRPSC